MSHLTWRGTRLVIVAFVFCALNVSCARLRNDDGWFHVNNEIDLHFKKNWSDLDGSFPTAMFDGKCSPEPRLAFEGLERWIGNHTCVVQFERRPLRPEATPRSLFPFARIYVFDEKPSAVVDDLRARGPLALPAFHSFFGCVSVGPRELVCSFLTNGDFDWEWVCFVQIEPRAGGGSYVLFEPDVRPWSTDNWKNVEIIRTGRRN